ncbi:MAG TPA: M3 family metallopeptidase [Kofleriaceae bacterium]|nr:M3 family metallopeptidase [Kofleriaceae bacterium]
MILRTFSAVAVALAVAACSGSAQETPVSNPITTSPEEPAETPPVVDPVTKPDPVAAFATECRAGLENAKKILPTILAVENARTVDNTLVPYNMMTVQFSNSDAIAGLMQSVHPDEKIREAARVCEQELATFRTDLGLNQALYQAFADLDTSSMDADTKRLVEHTIRNFKRSGVDKDEETRTRIREINDELTKVGQQFGKIIAEDVRKVQLDPAELEGLPEDFIKAHKADAQGKVTITTDYPDYLPFIQYAKSAEARKKLYVAFRSRGADANEANLKRILELRWELAKLLGYPNWADYITEDKMMKSSKNAGIFIDRVVKASNARAKKDYAELLAAKKKDDKKAKVVEDYDKSYYENKVKADKYAFDSQAVRPYFEYEAVEKGLLDITSKIYDIQYVKAADAVLWSPAVKAFDVMRGGTKLGRIYLDMHPREGKYKHAAQFTKLVGVKGVQLPEGVLVCNFPDPAKSDDPALMEHGDVVTMFHEFGHLMHHVFGGQQRWADQSGVATEWDFVEAPSQMFEEWAWNHDTLSLFAKHVETGEVIPADLVAKMRKADLFGLGIQTKQQMFYASISMNFYKTDPAKLNMHEEVKRLQTKMTPFRHVEGTKFHASFGHLYGYSAQYYTYMWSLVIAKDLLTPFKKHGLMNTEWTYAYRDKILAPGGTKDAAQLVRDLLGREFNYKAFENYLAGK